MFSRSSRGRLTLRDVGRFPAQTLFDRIARAVCEVGCLPRKELYETWEMARRVRRRVRGGRVVDLGAGHGLLAQLMVLLDASSSGAVAVDTSWPPSSGRLHAALVRQWPQLAGRVTFVTGELQDVQLRSTDVVVSCHACGQLTDRVLASATAMRASVAVLPCCHDFGSGDTGRLEGWLDRALAIDVMRANRLAEQGYRIWTQDIPGDITPKNRLLIGCARGPLEVVSSHRDYASKGRQ